VTRITGGILAGGEGKRFGGVDKGWLQFGGRCLVERVREALVPQVDELIISANRNLERYAALGHPVVTDDVGRGPAAGVLRLLEAASHPWVLCVPCDAPQLPPTLARDFLDAQWAEEADVVVLRDGEHLHPTCCLVSRELAPDLRRYLVAGHTALWRWQASHRLAHLMTSSPFLNLNDAEALERYAKAGTA
jgi:molybdopterin-guanine dinucleotide biosynthesis protein A